ncbi:hypothetical protein [[Clostridium] innocuum]|uniref:hypothetical protein n=1 Tax=Clostridium innocuum TaxID=1522 RepID=UPI001FCB9E6A|nr:hypothetical protein [[Clostridium] innocuum]BDF01614.1 hypothetical protein CE91St51_36510 [[Clostridium] innocuum]BDF02794.1 hypothetical protein CE91St51_48310 [[Clostridium] innocuum]
MDLDKQIDMLVCTDNKKAYNALKELLVISEQSNALYSYFDIFVEMMNNQNNSYIRTRGLRLIAYNSKWDINNQVNSIIEKWLKHIEDEKPITARQCIKDTVIIAKNKPELIDIILEKLSKINRIYDDSMQSLIYKDRQKVIRQIKQLTW